MTIHPIVEHTNGHRTLLDLPDWVTRDQAGTRTGRRAAPVATATEPVKSTTQVELDADLQKTVRQSGHMRQAFYAVVLIVALTGQVIGAHEALYLHYLFAIPAVAALELGGIVVLNNADVRRRLGERAVGSRVLSALIAAWAVTFNWMAHDNKLLAGFFAGMSALGYLVWVMHTENQRRDRLRAKGDLPPTAPAYELWGHWVLHPWITRRARSLAKQHAHLTLYTSLDEARAERTRKVRSKAIATVVGEEIRRNADPHAARIALAVYDLNEIAVRLEEDADYTGLTALVAARLNPKALVSDSQAHPTGALRAQSPDALRTHLDAVAGRVPDALPAVSGDALDARLDAPDDRVPDASTGAPEGAFGDAAGEALGDAVSDAALKRTQTRSALPLKRTSGGTGRTRQGPDVTRLLKHASASGKTPSIREVQRLLNVGAPKAKALMQEAGLLPGTNPQEGN
ncbi:hypothetical protein GCM10010399_92800 [Dactylosporangium fulvum]|uniref:DUF2637 domain-containing protein n=1 Tax=Dactylosporangium fulvum TaxID=53359 RepID=A0ABY5W7K0_9ACTN|nr:hypothetical protein [Dactylosporangium fulvum]UWP85847.1 hypothetical protein Dfulv_17010 [Dactylosporangium fulvum]